MGIGRADLQNGNGTVCTASAGPSLKGNAQRVAVPSSRPQLCAESQVHGFVPADSSTPCSEQSRRVALSPVYINPGEPRTQALIRFLSSPPPMNTTTTTKVSLNTAGYLAALTDQNLQPSCAMVYDIPERPRARVPKLPILRYEEDCPTITISDADEQYCLTGYGEISVSEHYNVVETGEDEQKLRVPRLRHTRPRARYQTQIVKAVSDPVSESESDESDEPLLTGDVRQLEPEYFRHTVHATLANPPASPNTDFREFFENLLRRNPPPRRQRTLALPNRFASEAIDARPRSN